MSYDGHTLSERIVQISTKQNEKLVILGSVSDIEASKHKYTKSKIGQLKSGALKIVNNQSSNSQEEHSEPKCDDSNND